MNWHKSDCIVTINHPGESRSTVSGYVSEPFAIHHAELSFGALSTDWTLTHLKTGAAIKGYIRTLSDAKALAEALAHLDWNFTSYKSPKVRQMGPEVKRIFSEVLPE